MEQIELEGSVDDVPLQRVREGRMEHEPGA